MMDAEAIAQRKQAILDRYGRWTNHNILLPDGSYTQSPELSGAEVKLQRFVQVVADFCGRDFSKLRVLDLACLEGLYGIELAMQGATVLGIEGRESNLAKARFTQEVLNLPNIEFVCDDVRHLSPDTYGHFNVVLCVGIFYHLDAPDVFHFAENIARVCTQVALFDTHLSQTADEPFEFRGRQYWGRAYGEDHTAWGSIGNEESTWLTRPSFYNLLSDIGFATVYECHHPPIAKYETMRHLGHADRNTFIALKQPPVALKTTQLLRDRPPERHTDYTA